jgi:glycine cleavage system H protein
MFPWNYGFHWSAGSALFLGAFYSVVAIVAASVIAALVRARRAARDGREGEVRWHAEFHDLPAADRLCRHMLTGEFRYRECPNAFDCRQCETHARLLEIHPKASPAESEEEVFGMAFPFDRLYHRGHTWVRPEPDGTVTIGLDDLGRRLIGAPDRVELPAPGTHVATHGPAWRIYKRNAAVRVLSPVDGAVIESNENEPGGLLRVKPDGTSSDLRHLLLPCEVKPWLLREMERLQLALSAEGAPALADGGVPVEDISANYPHADWDTVCGKMFLQG